jgi:hypothetical protein
VELYAWCTRGEADTKVGLELDHKVAALLEHLGTRVPEELAYS